MLDWFSGVLGYDGSAMALGRFFETSPGGEIVREKDRWETARGSWESGVQVTRSEPTVEMLDAARGRGLLCGPRAVVRVSGNPVKFLQGHNAAGPSAQSLDAILRGMVRAFPLDLRPGDADEERFAARHTSRIDLTTYADLGSHQAVHDWLKLAATVTRSRHGRPIDSSGTVYWGKHSRRWTIKAYCKHCELGVHPPIIPGMAAELEEWTRGLLRVELTLRRPELLQDTETPPSEGVIWKYLARLEIPTMRAHTRLDDVGLSSAAKMALLAWSGGNDVSVALPKTSFYRHRRAILDAVGVDISMSAKDQLDAESNALLGVDELKAREVVEIPERIQRSLFGAG